MWRSDCLIQDTCTPDTLRPHSNISRPLRCGGLDISIFVVVLVAKYAEWTVFTTRILVCRMLDPQMLIKPARIIKSTLSTKLEQMCCYPALKGIKLAWHRPTHSIHHTPHCHSPPCCRGSWPCTPGWRSCRGWCRPGCGSCWRSRAGTRCLSACTTPRHLHHAAARIRSLKLDNPVF